MNTKKRGQILQKIKRQLQGEPPEQIPPPKVNIRLFQDPLKIWDEQNIEPGTYVSVEELKRLEHELVSQLGCMPVDADIYRIAETVKKTMKKMIPQEEMKDV
jgi:hypothetical protein